ncbi:MAG: hypothetical protein ACRDP6_26625 [Actinoallomurus sp.]
MVLKNAGRVLVPVICCLMVAACNGGSPSGTEGAPPGQNVPGAPAGGPGGGGGNGGGGDVPVAPYKIPDIVIKAGDVYADLDAWHRLQEGFWSACPGGSHCVTPVFTLDDGADNSYPACAMERLEANGVRITEVGTELPMGSRITVSFKRPCPGLEGGGVSSPGTGESPSPDASAIDEPDTS